MVVLDNFFPKDLIDSLIFESYDYKWNFSKADLKNDLYWTNFIFGKNYNNKETEYCGFRSKKAEECWEFFKNKVNCGITNNNLESLYFNGLTYGLEAHAHKDSDQDDYVTVITYVCESWNSYWGGETVFFSGDFVDNPADKVFYEHEIIKTVIPRYNRVVIFQSKMVHCVRPVTKSFKGLRKTMMFKIKNKNIKDFCKLCS